MRQRMPIATGVVGHLAITAPWSHSNTSPQQPETWILTPGDYFRAFVGRAVVDDKNLQVFEGLQ